MKYYPINLDIKNRKCLVVGGGQVGTRKVMTLLECGARVTVISPELTDALKDLSDKGDIEWIPRPYSPRDVMDAFLIFGATNDTALNHRIHEDTEAYQKLCNIADQPEFCNFILPSVVNRGDLVITVSTSGKSPAYAKKLRQSLEDDFGEEHIHFLRLMGEVRKRVLEQNGNTEDNKHVFEKLVNSDLLELIRKNDDSAINERLGEILGDGYDYKELIQTHGE